MANGEKGKGRSNNQRLKLFYLLDYLLKNTDETHTVKVQEIIDHFDNYYKIPVEQKTVCSDLHLLDEYGYETQYPLFSRKLMITQFPILAEITVRFRLLQEDQKFFVSVDLLHCFGSLENFDIQIGVSFLIAPREEDLQCASVTVD